MKAAVKVDESKKLVLMDVPIPELKPSEALVKVHTTGLCGSDVAIRNNTFMGRHGRVELPVIPGHEFCGEVVAIGSQVKKVKIGERVTTSCILGCGECYACRTGIINRCRKWIHIGIDIPGCFAEYLAVDQDILFHVPDFIPDEHAAVLEPVTTAARAVRTNKITPGSFIVMFGPGPFGLFIMQAMLATSPKRLVMVGLSSDSERLKLAKELGATDIIQGDIEDPVEIINEMTKGRGAEVVVEATGKVEAVTQAMEAAAGGGLILMGGSGFGGHEISFKPWNVVRDEKKLKGLQGFEWADYLLALDLYSAGKMKIAPLISGVMPLSEVNEACEIAEAKKGMKIVLRP
ncbi:MAG TPA: L-threonine 3-dehydrogenase [Ruminiclostridium sp.]|nr:L-threonine 3-dehydrogenase [Ruminiclostridium sp.]